MAWFRIKEGVKEYVLYNTRVQLYEVRLGYWQLTAAYVLHTLADKYERFRDTVYNIQNIMQNETMDRL